MSAGGGEDALFGVEDPLGGVAVGAGDRVDRRPVGPPQRVRFLDPVGRCFEGDRSVLQDFRDEEVDQAVGLVDRQVDGAGLALGFGADVPQLPGRPALFQHRHDPVSGLADPASIGHAGGICCRRERGVDHCRDGVTAAEDRSSFIQPGGTLFGVRAGFVFGVAGLQRGLLGQVKSFDRGGWPAMICLELDGEFAAAGVDEGTSAGPALVQSRVDADDLADGPLRRVGAGPFGEPHAQRVAEVLFEGGVVGFRGRHLRFEQHPSVDGQPASVEGLDLVRDRDVGVQIRVAGPAVAVGERGRHQPVDVDLPDPLWPGPGEQRLLLDEPQRIGDGGLVRPLDRRRQRSGRRPPTTSRPTSPARTSGRSRRPSASVVESPWRSGLPAPGVDRVAAVLRVEELFRHLGPDPGPGGGRDLGVGRCADQGVQVSDPLRHLDPERRRLIDDPERSAEPHRLLECPA